MGRIIWLGSIGIFIFNKWRRKSTIKYFIRMIAIKEVGIMLKNGWMLNNSSAGRNKYKSGMATKSRSKRMNQTFQMMMNPKASMITESLKKYLRSSSTTEKTASLKTKKVRRVRRANDFWILRAIAAITSMASFSIPALHGIDPKHTNAHWLCFWAQIQRPIFDSNNRILSMYFWNRIHQENYQKS